MAALPWLLSWSWNGVDAVSISCCAVESTGQTINFTPCRRPPHTHTPLPPHTLPHLTHWLTCAPEHTRTHILSICVNWKHTAAHLSHMWSLTELAQWAECNIKSHSHTDTQVASFLSLKMAPFHNNRGQSGLGMIWTGVPALSTNEQLTPKGILRRVTIKRVNVSWRYLLSNKKIKTSHSPLKPSTHPFLSSVWCVQGVDINCFSTS